MKKKLLLGFISFLSLSSFGQQNNQSIILQRKGSTVHHEVVDANPILKQGVVNKSKINNHKKTRATSRWYSYTSAIDTLYGGNGAVFNNLAGVRLWHDSTVKQIYSTGAGTINYSSYYNVLDPVGAVFNDVNLYPGEIAITPSNTYTVDSIAVWGSYLRPKGGNPDTLIISVVKGSATSAINDILFYNPNKTSFPEMITNGYVSGVGGDTSMTMPTIVGDSIRSIGVNSNQAFVIKKILTDADTSSFVTPFEFALPTPLSGEADRMVGVTVTFKTGNPYIQNVDTVSVLNNFMGIFAEEVTGAAQEYFGNAPDFDLNMSGLMFSTSRDSYYPSFFIEGWNSNTFRNELALIDYHVNCTSCIGVGVNNVSNINDVKVFPNPATNEVNFSMNIAETAKNVTIEISNAIGQVVKTIDLGSVRANSTVNQKVSVSDLTAGMYIYTINADGQKQSNKLMVH